MKRILSLLLSAMLLLSISFTTFAESNVITTNIQTLEKSDEKCVVKETRTDSIIIVKVKSFAPRQIQRRLFAALVTLSRKVFRPWHKWF